MGIVFLLLLIPIFCIGVVLYATTLYDFIVTGNFNELLFLISTVITVVSSYFIPKAVVKVLPFKTAKALNNKNKVLILSNYISLILMLVFGVVMLYRGLVSINYVQIIVGVGCIFLFFYTTYFYFFNYEKKEFILQLVVDRKKYKELTFNNDDIFLNYYVEDNKLKEGKRYVVEYNRYTNVVKKVHGMILGGGKHEEDN